MSIFDLPPIQIVKLFIELAKKKLAWLSIGFAAISILVLGAAFMLPKTYMSHTTILADKEGVLSPLMEGAAVTNKTKGKDRDRIELYKEMLFGAAIMQPVIVNAGWVKKGATDVEKSRAILELLPNINVKSAGPNLVRIEVNDSDPERAFRTAKMLGDMFIAQSLEGKQSESRSAYEFVDRQVKGYHKKLLLAEQKLKEFKTKNLGNHVGTEKGVFDRINDLRAQIEEFSLQVQEESIRERSLTGQLAGEKQLGSSLQVESGLASRIRLLEQELATLRLDYHDSYPDVVRLKHQIDDLKEMLKKGDGDSGFSSAAAAAGNLDTVYGSLREQLAETRTRKAGLSTRVAQSRKLLALELERAKDLPEVEAELSELTRDYEVTNDVYQDLVKRRENARVSMNIDIEQSDQRFAIQEPALVPLQSSGLRFFHVAAVGPILGVGGPLAALFVLFQLGGNVRHKSQITKEMGTRLLGEIPFTSLPTSPRMPNRTSIIVSVVALALVANAYLFAAIFKVKELGITLPLM
jgi:polysaccharide chain length determinant protein (PEP-CTERM system associated)